MTRKVGKKEDEKKRKDEKKKKKQRVHLSSLDFPGVLCVSSLEQRPGNLIPFSIYLNPFTQTPLPTSSTFGLFLPFSACLPSVRHRYVPPLFVLLLHGTVSFHSSSSSERRHTFPPLLACFTNVASRIFGKVLNKVPLRRRERERRREGGDWLNR